MTYIETQLAKLIESDHVALRLTDLGSPRQTNFIALKPETLEKIKAVLIEAESEAS